MFRSNLSLRRRPASLTLILLVALFAQLLPMIGGAIVQSPQRAAAATDVGYQGPSMSGASAATGQKPQSKLWFNDGSWWGVLWSTSQDAFTIWRFNWDANSWTDTGIVVDTRNRTSADALWTGSRLFIGSAVKENVSSSDMSARILRYSYSSSSKTYTLDSGFPVTVANTDIEALIIDQDGIGRLWATWTQANGSGGRQVMLTRSNIGGTSFITPFVLPVANAANLDVDDISTLVAYDTDKVGVLWSNQATAAVYWASHDDAAADGAWSVQPALSGPGYADDHLNIKSLQSDASGRVFAAVKTSLNDINPSTSQQPLILLLVLDGPGSWQRYTFSRVVDNQTRPIVLVSPQNRQLFMFAAGPCCSGGVVYYKQTSLDSPSFATGQGDPFISLSTNTTINNPTSTKQPLTLESGALVIAGDDRTHNYVFNKIAFSQEPTAPDTTITGGPSGTVSSTSATFSFSATDPAATFDCALDGAAFAACTSPNAYANLSEAAHTFQVRASNAVGTDATPASRTWTVDVTPPDTLIDSSPSDGATGPATFSFHATEASATFACSLDGGAATSCTSPTTYSSLSAAAHSFAVTATDLAGNVDPSAATASWTQSTPSALFSDDFESGTLDNWDVTTAVGGIATVVAGYGTNGTNIAALSETSTTKSVAYARRTFPTALTTVTVSGDFNIVSEGALRGNVPLFRFFDAAGSRTIVLYRQNQFSDRVYVTYGGSTFLTSGTVALNTWVDIEIRVVVNGAGASSVQVLLNGTSIHDSSTASLTNAIKTIQIGNDTQKQAFSLRADNIVVADGSAGGSPPPTAPETTITSAPAATTSSSSASFSFASSISGSSFECALDGAAFAVCTSPQSYSSLADGSHTFQVRATAAGVTDPTPAGDVWVVDTTPPTVLSTVPVANATDVAVNSTVTATFSEPMDPATISASTFSLTPTGGSAIAASFAYDGATRTARLTPSTTLAAATTYSALIASGSSGVHDVAGNGMALDSAWTFTTSSAPPPPTGTITRESTATTVNATATSTVLVNAPVGVVAGDVLVSCLSLNGGGVSLSGIPAGWEPIASVTSIANPRVFGYYKVAGVSEPANYTWTLASSVANSAGIARYSGVDAAQPFAGTASSATGASSTTATLPGVTTSVANAQLIGCMAANSSSASLLITAPAGMSEAWNLAGKRQELADHALAVAGDSGTRSWTFSGAREWAGWLVALRPG